MTCRVIALVTRRCDDDRMPTTARSGRTIRFDRAGAGPPLVLLHGLFQHGATWDQVGYLGALTEHFEVITIDSVGHGGSDHPRGIGEYRAERRVDDVTAVLDELEIDDAYIWGYSMGGWQALSCVRHAPERVRGVIAGGWCPARGLATTFDVYVTQFGFDPETDWFAALVDLTRNDPIVGPALADGVLASFELAFRACEREGGGFDDDLVRFERPVILYSGTHDPYHDSTAAVADAVGAQFVSLADADHGRAFVDGATAVAAVMPLLVTSVGR